MKEIIEILMHRDGISYSAAKHLIKECREELFENMEHMTYEDATNIIEYWLGLEPDYLDYFLM